MKTSTRVWIGFFRCLALLMPPYRVGSMPRNWKRVPWGYLVK